MRRQGNRVLKKLRGRAGETLAETLVALLIGALSLVMLAGAVSAGSNMINNSKKKLTDYYSANQKIVTKESKSDTLGITIYEDGTDTGIGTTNAEAYYFLNDEFGSKAVISYSYKKPTSGGAG